MRSPNASLLVSFVNFGYKNGCHFQSEGGNGRKPFQTLSSHQFHHGSHRSSLTMKMSCPACFWNTNKTCLHAYTFSFHLNISKRAKRPQSLNLSLFILSLPLSLFFSFSLLFLYFHPFRLLCNALSGSKCSVLSLFERCVFV